MNWKLLITGAAAAAALASQAQALDFNFTFSSNLTLGDDTIVPGSVIGRIYGLADNGASVASDVKIFGVADGVTDLPATPFSLFDYAHELSVLLNQPGLGVTQNFFEVQNGQITFAIFQIFGGYFDIDVQNQYNSMVSPAAQTRVQNLGGSGACPSRRRRSRRNGR